MENKLEKVRSDLERKTTESYCYKGVTFVNITTHDFNMVNKKGETIVIHKSGFVVNARERLEMIQSYDNGAVIKNLSWEEDPVGRIKLDILQKRYPGAIVLGSKIAAHGYPGEICFCRKLVPEYFKERRPSINQDEEPVFYLDSLTTIK